MDHYGMLRQREGEWRAYVEIVKDATHLLSFISGVVPSNHETFVRYRDSIIESAKMKFGMITERGEDTPYLHPNALLDALKKYVDEGVPYSQELFDQLSSRLHSLEELAA